MSYIHYTEFDANRMIGEKHQAKDLKENGKVTGQYYEIPLKYDFGTKEKPQYKNLYIEGPEMEVSGIAERSGNGKTGYSIHARFPLDNPECQAYVKCVDAGYRRVVELLNNVKGAVKMFNFSKDAPEGLLPHPVYRPRDDVTGELDLSMAPSQWLKLQNYTWDGKEKKTVFSIPPTTENPTPEPLNWNLLYDITMKIIPIMSWQKIYIGQKAYIQSKLTSAIVTDIKPRERGSHQAVTMNRLVQADPTIGNRLSEQISKLTMNRREISSNFDHNDIVNPVVIQPSNPPQNNFNQQQNNTSQNNINQQNVPPQGIPLNISAAPQNVPPQGIPLNIPQMAPQSVPQSIPLPVQQSVPGAFAQFMNPQFQVVQQN